MRRFQIFIVVILLVAMQSLHSVEIKRDQESPLISQIAQHVLHTLESAIKSPEMPLSKFALQIDDGASQKRTEARIAKTIELFKKNMSAVSKDFRLTFMEPATVIKTNDELELIVLIIFQIQGSELKSGIMTLQISQPAVRGDIIDCGVQLGHIGVSMNACGEE